MIKIISFIDSFKHYDKPILEFQKRLGKTVELIKLKPSKKKDISLNIKEETENIIKFLQNYKGYKVLLSIEGKSLDSINFSKLIYQKLNSHSNIIFAIGGVYGFSYTDLKNHFDFELSLSKMTFPHGLSLLLLYEQIYRGICINKGKNYHY